MRCTFQEYWAIRTHGHLPWVRTHEATLPVQATYSKVENINSWVPLCSTVIWGGKWWKTQNTQRVNKRKLTSSIKYFYNKENPIGKKIKYCQTQLWKTQLLCMSATVKSWNMDADQCPLLKKWCSLQDLALSLGKIPTIISYFNYCIVRKTSKTKAPEV